MNSDMIKNLDKIVIFYLWQMINKKKIAQLVLQNANGNCKKVNKILSMPGQKEYCMYYMYIIMVRQIQKHSLKRFVKIRKILLL